MIRHRFVVRGRPVPQPRARAASNGHHYTPDNGIVAFKQHVAILARQAGCSPRNGRIALWLTFVFARPKSHLTKAGNLRSSAPEFPGHGCGDTDNLTKGVKDALTGIAYHDDTQVCEEHIVKEYGDADATIVAIE